MRIEAHAEEPEAVAADLLAVPLAAPLDRLGGTAAKLDERVGGRLSELLRSGEARADAERVAILHVDGEVAAQRIALVGVGDREETDTDALRTAAASAARTATFFGATIAWALEPALPLSQEEQV